MPMIWQRCRSAALRTPGAKIVKPIFSFPGGRRFHFHDLDGYELAVGPDK
jgi:uncharacterized protein